MKLQIGTTLLLSALIVAAATLNHEDSTNMLTLLRRQEYKSLKVRQFEADNDIPISLLALQKRVNHGGQPQGNPMTYRSKKATDTTSGDSSGPAFDSHRNVNSRLPWRLGTSAGPDSASGKERGEDAEENPNIQRSEGSGQEGAGLGRSNRGSSRSTQQSGRKLSRTSQSGPPNERQQETRHLTDANVSQRNMNPKLKHQGSHNVIRADDSKNWRSYVPARPRPPPRLPSLHIGASRSSSAEQPAESSAGPSSGRVSGRASGKKSGEAASGSEVGPSGSGSRGLPRR